MWAGKPYSFSSDLWSLGCVLYEMMTFKTPMEGRSMQVGSDALLGVEACRWCSKGSSQQGRGRGT